MRLGGTIVEIKSGDDREPDIQALEDLLARRNLDRSRRSRIEREIRTMQAGVKGERDAAYEIELYFGRSANWVTVHDLRFEVDAFSAQIDHLIINRLLDIWVCESKSFAEGVTVNAHGEWSRYFGGKPVGIPSPIEQNRRHIHLLRRLFDDGAIPIPKRAGAIPMRPDLRGLVLVSNNARIGRPRAKLADLDQVVKAEQLKTRLFDEFDRSFARNAWKLIGTDRLEAFGRQLAALHRPIEFDWPTRFGLTPTSPPAVHVPVPKDPGRPRRTSGHRCAACSAEVSFAVVRYCWNNKARFGGEVYCIRCQRDVSSSPRSA
jgi:hypothetical protein